MQPSSAFHEQTWSERASFLPPGPRSRFMLSLLWHPEPARVGQQALLEPPGGPWRLSRGELLFDAGEGTPAQPLGHASVSRSALQLEPLPDGSLRLSCAEAQRLRCEIDGQALDAARAASGLILSPARLAAGVVMALGPLVWLCLHLSSGPRARRQAGAGGLVGISAAMELVRRQLEQVAPSDLPVLLLGESGTGKEMLARALHAGSPRRQGPLISVNMAALSEGLAVADLFGALRGAYTGATGARQGLFAEAAGGSLFLDEIGDAPTAVQPMLLRVLETGEYRPLGGSSTLRADVRLIAATDRDLQARAGFNQPLLRRLEGFVMAIPPLRQRREDLGVLLLHLMQRAAAERAAGPELRAEALPPALLRSLFLHDWPGNVRQLWQAVRRLQLAQLAGEWPGESELLGLAAAPSALEALSAVPAPAAARRRHYIAPDEISPERLLRALDDSGWCLLDAAQALGVSRPSLYNLLARHPEVRPAHSLSAEDISQALACSEGTPDLSRLAISLRTPREALRRRLRALGLKPPG